MECLWRSGESHPDPELVDAPWQEHGPRRTQEPDQQPGQLQAPLQLRFQHLPEVSQAGQAGAQPGRLVPDVCAGEK